MANTTILTYTNNLISNLQQRSGLAGVSIVDGPPEMTHLQLGEWIALLDVNGEQTWQAISRVTKPRNERLVMDVMIDVVSPGTNIQTVVNERALELFYEIEDELRANPSQDVQRVMITSQIAKPFSLLKRANTDEGWRECMIGFGIEINARL